MDVNELHLRVFTKFGIYEFFRVRKYKFLRDSGEIFLTVVEFDNDLFHMSSCDILDFSLKDVVSIQLIKYL